jgi:2-aminoadipate transaminase
MNVFSDRIKSLQPSAIREILKFTADPNVISFAAGNPAPEAFPVDIIRTLSDEIFNDNPIAALQYSLTEGYTPLRNRLKADMEKKNIYNSKQDELIITNGAQQAIETLTKIICNEGDTILCESPSFIGSLNAFRSYRAKLVGIEMDNEGIDVEKLETALKNNPRTAFLYLIPNFQNPSGKTMSMRRRREVLELAYKYNIMILEDNPYGDLRFYGQDLPTLKELDTKGHVMYVGSFSKTLAPGLRVGYLCAPESIVQKAVVSLQVSTVHPNIWGQILTYRFLETQDFEQHLENLRVLYKHKCELMINSLNFSMPLSIQFTQPEGGLFIWGTLPDGDMRYFCKKAVENGVAVVPGNAFLVNENEVCYNFRINFSTPTDEQIEEGVLRLSKVAKTMYR